LGTFFPANHFAVTYNFILVLLKKLHPELTQQKQTRVSEPKDSIKTKARFGRLEAHRHRGDFCVCL